MPGSDDAHSHHGTGSGSAEELRASQQSEQVYLTESQCEIDFGQSNSIGTLALFTETILASQFSQEHEGEVSDEKFDSWQKKIIDYEAT